jgi:ABC-type antimicrobial peptide transport system permease subunit
MNSKEYEDALQNDRILKFVLRSKMIIICIYSVAVVIGLGFFIRYKIAGYDTLPSVCSMLVFWACGSIANFFDRDSMIRKLLSYIFSGIGNAFHSHSIVQFLWYLLGLALGIILGVLVMGAFSPILIISYLIGILRVKKQIANNNAILSKFETENRQ